MMLASFLLFVASAVACVVLAVRANYGGTADDRQGDAILAIICGVIAALSFITTLTIFVIKALS